MMKYVQFQGRDLNLAKMNSCLMHLQVSSDSGEVKPGQPDLHRHIEASYMCTVS